MMTNTIDPDRRKKLQEKLLEHLEAAQAITDELGLADGAYLVELGRGALHKLAAHRSEH